MENWDIRKTIECSATLEEVWPLIGTGEGLGRWLVAEIELASVLGGRYRERHADQQIIGGHVIQLEKPHTLVLSCRVETTPETTWPIYTTLEMKLTCANGGTRLSVWHQGFENLPEAYREQMFETFATRWVAAVGRLEELLS